MSRHRRASEHLESVDPVIARVHEDHGPVILGRAPRVDERFETIARAIAHQQLATAAARTIWSRVHAVVGEPFVAERLLATDPRHLRAAGLSGSKLAALLDLALHVEQGRVRLDRFGRMRDEEVIAELVTVRGIGVWTAQMFLINALHRLDVWPTGDLGVRVGYGRGWLGGATPSAKELEPLGDRFRPYRTIAAIDCWRLANA